MRRLFCTILTALLAVLASAQYNITGRVIDEMSRQPLDFVNVALYAKNQTTPLQGVMSDAQGRFTLTNVAPGAYNVEVSFVGYSTRQRAVSVSTQSVDIGRIALREDVKQLGEVEVVTQGSTMRFELDRKVFSVDQNIASTGGSASDALENIPSVEVDNEGNISMRNSEDVEIWINGKPSGLTADNRAQLLQQMPAETIQEIELITNPSAKYNPEGTAGIINIVLKRDRKAGYYGSVSAGIDYPDGARQPGYKLNASVNMNAGIVDAYLNVGYNTRAAAGSSWSDRINYLTADTTRLLQDGTTDRNSGGIFLRGGIDLHLGAKSTLGLSAFGVVGDRSENNRDISYTLTDLATGSTLRNYMRSNHTKGGRPSYNLALDYRIDISRQQNLALNVSYRNFDIHNKADIIQTTLIDNTVDNGQLQKPDETNHNWEMKADYEWKPTDQSRLEAGWQSDISHRTQLNSATDQISKAELTAFYNDFDYREQIHAAYITYGNRFFDRLSLQVGLRGEYFRRQTSTASYTVTIDNNKSYWQLFPSAYIAYTLPHNHELQLNYTRRVDRPRGWRINPFRDLTDSTTISYGNPELMPQFTHSLELNYLKMFEQHTLTASLFYKLTEETQQNVRYMNGDVMESTYINMATRQETGLEFIWKARVKSWLQLTSSVSGYYARLQAADDVLNSIPVHVEGSTAFTWRARINASLMFTKTFSGQLTGRYSSPRVEAQGSRTSSYSIDLGLRKSFFD
ncbi:MAG: TonB-dependent receptor, partial [Paludibacteraceae bacterium]|nr:TonB-dependent receptor [Paludibacteraceae bacterium]